jgi:hypothetical protein
MKKRDSALIPTKCNKHRIKAFDLDFSNQHRCFNVRKLKEGLLRKPSEQKHDHSISLNTTTSPKTPRKREEISPLDPLMSPLSFCRRPKMGVKHSEPEYDQI